MSDVSSICLNPDTPQERLPSIPESEVPERATGSRTREELGPFARVPKFSPACRSERVGALCVGWETLKPTYVFQDLRRNSVYKLPGLKALRLPPPGRVPGIWPGCTQARGATWVWTAWTSATSAGTPARFEPLGSSCAPRGPSGQVRTGTPGTVGKCHLEENATREPDLSLQPHVSSRVPGCGREPKIPKPAQRSLTPGTGYAASATSWRWGRGKGPTKGKPKPCST